MYINVHSIYTSLAPEGTRPPHTWINHTIVCSVPSGYDLLLLFAYCGISEMGSWLEIKFSVSKYILSFKFVFIIVIFKVIYKVYIVQKKLWLLTNSSFFYIFSSKIKKNVLYQNKFWLLINSCLFLFTLDIKFIMSNQILTCN